jgi:hypothetical protein
MAMAFISLRHAAIAAALTIAAIPAANAGTVFNNIASSQDGSDPVFGVGPLYQSFSTGSLDGALDSVELLLYNTDTAYNGNLQVTLVANGNQMPGTAIGLIGTIPDGTISTSSTGGLYTLDPAAALVLAPDTTYWIEVSQATPNAIEWGYSLDTTATGVSGQYAYNQYGLNPVSGYGAYQADIQVPEPASIAALSIGLTGLAGLRRRRRSRIV